MPNICLQVSDIIYHIVSYLDERLVDVALISPAFYDPAMDKVWRRLEGIEPLLQLLASEADRSTYHRTSMIVGDAPSDKDWSRLLHHGHRVRELTLDEADDHFRVYGYLLDGCPRFPLPYLRQLTCHNLQCLHIFFAPSVERLTIRCHRDSIGLVCSFIENQGQGLRELRLLDRLGEDKDGADNDAISSAVLSLKHLASFQLNGSLPTDALIHLAHLETLQSLTYSPLDIACQDILIESPNTFWPLRKLGLLVAPSRIHDATSFLSSIRPRSLLQLDISDAHDSGPRVLDVNAFSRFLASISGFQSLTVVNLEFGEVLEPDAFIGSPLSALYALHNLREIRLLGITLALACADTDAMSKAWPKLQVLVFKPSNYRYPILHISGLLPFARNCPDLTEIFLYVDGLCSSISPSEFPHDAHTSLRRLSMGLLPPSISTDPQSCVDFLARVFPYATLEALQIWRGDDDAIRMINVDMKRRREETFSRQDNRRLSIPSVVELLHPARTQPSLPPEDI